MSDILIVGCGYVGSRVARQHLDRGDFVRALVRSAAGVKRLSGLPIRVMRRDLALDDLAELRSAGCDCFHLAPPPNRGVEDIHTRRLVAAFARVGHPRRMVYVSTTGVYGDCGGAWVDETWPVRPAAERAKRRWDAENVLRRWSEESGGELVILRVAGIYGMGRLPLERIHRGLPLVRPEQAPFTNRIHVVDLVSALEAAMARGITGAVYNVSDGHPSNMTDYFIAVADAVGLPRPPLISLDEAEGQLSDGMLSYLAESRRLSNRKLVEELGVVLRYPTLTEGLQGMMLQGGPAPTTARD